MLQLSEENKVATSKLPRHNKEGTNLSLGENYEDPRCLSGGNSLVGDLRLVASANTESVAVDIFP